MNPTGLFVVFVNVQNIAYCDPVRIFEQWKHQAWALLFNSALEHKAYGRFSYIAVEPFQTLVVKDGVFFVDDRLVNTDKNPFDFLNDLLAPFKEPILPNLPPFQGGVAGAFSYDLYHYMESIPPHALDDTKCPDLALGFYDVVISFDHQQQRAWLVSTGLPEVTASARSAKAQLRLNKMMAIITQCTASAHPVAALVNAPSNEDTALPIVSNFTKDTYCDAVSRVIDYILAGDIFEANISQRFQTTLPKGLTPFELYLQLRHYNPAPFAAFLNLGEIQIVSASPERFLHLLDKQVETRPIKGTAPRSSDNLIDQQLAQTLLSSEKDRSENMMIVDLLRNDLSKVCVDHSVNVTTLCGLEQYATVHHLVSVIIGTLKENKNALDLFIAAFPSGSITGAPKVRAMQIIAEIEPSKRGVYCGSLGFIGFNGTMDTSVAIRTFIIKNGVVTFQAGGAIVSDSSPSDEYQETLTKAHALKHALKPSS